MVENFPSAWYNSRMEIKIVRSKRKTLSLTVTREGEVVVRAPARVSLEYIEKFVQKHRAWVEKRLSAVAAQPKLSLRDGETVALFGSSYRIRKGRARLSDGELFLPEEGREEAFVRLLKKFALEVMTVFTDRVAREHGLKFRAVRISSARGRWGSCNKEGTIAYTFRVAFLPPELCEYVAAHELAHTLVFNHSAAFWKEVERILPDYKERRKRLKANPAIGFL